MSAGPKASEWTVEKTEALRTMIAARRSYARIAEILGISRNAVSGKAFRLGLAGPASRAMAGKTATRRSRRRAAEPGWDGREPANPPEIPENSSAPIPDLDAAPPDAAEPVTITGLRRGLCHWPLWDREARGGLYCGAETPAGSSWCAHHRRVAFFGRAGR